MTLYSTLQNKMRRCGICLSKNELTYAHITSRIHRYNISLLPIYEPRWWLLTADELKAYLKHTKAKKKIEKSTAKSGNLYFAEICS